MCVCVCACVCVRVCVCVCVLEGESIFKHLQEQQVVHVSFMYNHQRSEFTYVHAKFCNNTSSSVSHDDGLSSSSLWCGWEESGIRGSGYEGHSGRGNL